MGQIREKCGGDPLPPARQYLGNTDAGRKVWEKRTMQHIAAVHRGRPMSLIVAALKSRWTELIESGSFAPVCKKIVQKSLGIMQDRFSARLSVHLWDRLELSRRKMEDLMHLVSCIYRPLTNTYDRIVV